MELQHPIGWDITPISWQETWLYTTYTPLKRPPIHQLYTTCIHLLSGTWPSSFLKAFWTLTARLVLGNLFFSFPSEMGCALAPALGFLLPEPIRNWKLPGSAGGLSWLLDLLVSHGELWWALRTRVLCHALSTFCRSSASCTEGTLEVKNKPAQHQARSSLCIQAAFPRQILRILMKRRQHSSQALTLKRKRLSTTQLYPGPGMYAQHWSSRTCLSTTINHRSIYWQGKHGKMEINVEFLLISFDFVLWPTSVSANKQLRTTKVCQSHQCLLLFYFRCSRQWRNTARSILHPRIAIYRYMYCVYLHICTCVCI